MKRAKTLAIAASILLYCAAAPSLARNCELDGESINPDNGSTYAGKTGRMKCFDEKGELVGVDELRDGDFVGYEWHRDIWGNVHERTTNANGNSQGVAREFWPDGTLKTEGTYDDGDAVGTQRKDISIGAGALQPMAASRPTRRSTRTDRASERDNAMRPVLLAVLLSVGVSPTVAAAHEAASTSRCAMQPAWRTLTLPERGFVLHSRDRSADRCDPVPESDWTRQGTLFVHTLGPEGSGRYWDVTVALDERAPPQSGLCFTTSTVGWRTLQRHPALKWLDDLDGDGRAEFILWDSFGLNGSESPAEQALIAWVYRPTPSNTLELDEALSRGQARALAIAYRAPLESSDAWLKTLRDDAALALQAFAEQRCVP